MILKGRRKILSEYSESDMRDINKVVKMLNAAFEIHNLNRYEIQYLIEYRKGQQPILDKTKDIRPEINNKLVLNHAQMITRDIVGYFLGTPIQYIQSGSKNKKEIEELNKFVAFEDKASTDMQIGENQSVCGTAYRIIYTDGQFKDDVPFEDKCLDPRNTFVIYENTIAETPLAGVTYHEILGDNNNTIGTKFYVYTSFGLYEIVSKFSVPLGSGFEYEFKQYSVGGVPIIEYPNNQWRIGDWELVLDLMDAINSVQSGRMDDIDQIVQSLMVFLNADIDADMYAEMLEAGVVMLKNNTGNKSDVKTVTNPLDQGGMSMFSAELEKLLYALIGIPDRNSRSGGGGDTGVAVELRDGWADLEIVARNKEMSFKRAEKQALRIILNILSNKLGFKLSLLDVDIKFSRNKNNNLLVKTQSFQTLLQTKTLSPEDCLTIVDLVSDVNEYISRGQSFWGEAFAGKIQADNSVKMSTDMANNSGKPVEDNPEKKEGETINGN